MTSDEQHNKETARKNLSRQEAAKHDPKVNEPGYVYNDDGAQIQNPGPVDGPYAPGPGQVVGERQLGDRVKQDDQENVAGFDTPSPNPSDKQGGEALTTSEPGSASIQRVADKDESLSREDTTKKAAANAKPKSK